MSIPVDKTLEKIRQDLFSRISEVQADYAKNGWLPSRLNLNKGVARGIIEIWAWGLFQLYQFLFLVLKQILIDDSGGAWLELLSRIVDLERKTTTKATGIINFTRVETAGNVPIPAGRIVKTLPDGAGRVYRFVTTEDAVMLDGESDVAVGVVSEDYGSAANVSIGQITQIATTIPGVDGVENREGWLVTEGADAEDDDSLRDRYILKWKGNNGCTKYAYEEWALSVTGVVAARIMDQHPRGQGTVDVVVQGTAGVPTSDLLTAVDAVVQENAPVNDDALVKGVAPVYADLAADLVLLQGTDPAVVLAEVDTRINDLFSFVPTVSGIQPFGIGEDIMRDRLVAVIMGVTGIKQVAWSSPSGNMAVPDDGLAVLNSASFTTSFAESD